VEKNEVFLENLEVDIRAKVSQRTHDLELGCTVQSVTRNFIFTSRHVAPVSLF
jgi:hypothetical protein